MRNSTLIGLVAALAGGVTIGVQVTLNSIIGKMVGPGRGALLVNVAGGTFAGLIIAALVLVQGRAQWQIPRNAIAIAAICGGIGILIVSSINYALPRTGSAAGIAALFLGQMIIGVVVDTVGQPGVDPIPLDVRRIAGLALMALAVALLAPRQ